LKDVFSDHVANGTCGWEWKSNENCAINAAIHTHTHRRRQGHNGGNVTVH
jgi:hypothetical protein